MSSPAVAKYVPFKRTTLNKRHGGRNTNPDHIDSEEEPDHTDSEEEPAISQNDASDGAINFLPDNSRNDLSPLPLPFPNQPSRSLEPPQIPIQTSVPVTFYPPPPDPHLSNVVMYLTIAALITTLIFAAFWSVRGCLKQTSAEESEGIGRRTHPREVNERQPRDRLHSSMTFPLPSMHVYSHRHGPRATEYIPFRFQRERSADAIERGFADDASIRSNRPNVEESMDRIAWLNAMIGTRNIVVNPDGSKKVTSESTEGSLKRCKSGPSDQDSTRTRSDDFDYPCSICLGDFEQGQSVRQLLCRHVYHQPCLDPWILYWQPVCPMCKRSVYDVTPLPLPSTSITTRHNQAEQERSSVENM